MIPATTVKSHPAPFSDSIVEELGRLIPLHVPTGSVIHDPFAGEGLHLGALCDRLGYRFSGTDLEPWLGADPRVLIGDATLVESYPTDPFVVVTSPTYNNGVNDHFAPKDDSRRLTYRVHAGRELHPNNTGRYSGRRSKKDEAAYWRLTRRAITHWPQRVIVNVKDSTRAGETYPLIALWTDLLGEFGYSVERVDVGVRGWRFGANSEARADSEAILVGVRR